jgi:hypothetical protein
MLAFNLTVHRNTTHTHTHTDAALYTSVYLSCIKSKSEYVNIHIYVHTHMYIYLYIYTHTYIDLSSLAYSHAWHVYLTYADESFSNKYSQTPQLSVKSRSDMPEIWLRAWDDLSFIISASNPLCTIPVCIYLFRYVCMYACLWKQTCLHDARVHLYMHAFMYDGMYSRIPCAWRDVRLYIYVHACIFEIMCVQNNAKHQKYS